MLPSGIRRIGARAGSWASNRARAVRGRIKPVGGATSSTVAHSAETASAYRASTFHGPEGQWEMGQNAWAAARLRARQPAGPARPDGPLRPSYVQRWSNTVRAKYKAGRQALANTMRRRGQPRPGATAPPAPPPPRPPAAPKRARWTLPAVAAGSAAATGAGGYALGRRRRKREY